MQWLRAKLSTGVAHSALGIAHRYFLFLVLNTFSSGRRWNQLGQNKHTNALIRWTQKATQNLASPGKHYFHRRLLMRDLLKPLSSGTVLLQICCSRPPPLNHLPCDLATDPVVLRTNSNRILLTVVAIVLHSGAIALALDLCRCMVCFGSKLNEGIVNASARCISRCIFGANRCAHPE